MHAVHRDTSRFMLAYVFWHWKRAHVAPREYELRQCAFHEALVDPPIVGFRHSFSFAPIGTPMPNGPNDGYEDWYLVDDFAALGAINREAVARSRTVPHAEAAALAEGGTAGVYELVCGSVAADAAHAHWFGKPQGVRYDEFLRQLTPLVAAADGALWMRQMTLGPAREYCLHARADVTLPAVLAALVLPLRTVWPRTGG